jgi:hypothetical protein
MGKNGWKLRDGRFGCGKWRRVQGLVTESSELDRASNQMYRRTTMRNDGVVKMARDGVVK